MQIEALSWDSAFFEINVAKVNVRYLNEIELSKCKVFDLTYLFVEEDTAEDINFLGPNFYLVDKKVTYKQKILEEDRVKQNKSICSYQSCGDDLDIIQIGMQSGIYSRFKTDPKFPEGKFEQLYSTWMKKSISREIASEVFVYNSGDNENAGVITLKEKDSFVEIGILAVDERHRGRNIGSLLIEAAKNYCINKGYNELQVSTQISNERACHFYTKNGFELIDVRSIYHIWNLA